MIYNELGNTGLRVSRIGLGLAALGRPSYINLGHGVDLEGGYDPNELERKAHRVLNKASEYGITYFDAARSYGKAEDFLSSWIHKRDPQPEVIIGSKWGYTYVANWQINAKVHEIKEHSLNVLNRQWLESNEQLGSKLSLYQIHSATLSSGVLENDEVLDRLAELKADGTLIGLSLSGPKQGKSLQKALNIQKNGKLLFDSVQATWNILETSAETQLKEAKNAGLGIILKEVVANGRLTERNDSNTFKDKKKLLSHWSAEAGVSIDAWAIGVALQQSWVDIVLSGATTEGQLKSNLDALKLISPGEAGDEWRSISEDPKDYWQKRSQLKWN